MNLNKALNLKKRDYVVKKMIMGASIKILVNYYQTIAILNTLHLNWNQTLLDIFNIQKTFSGGLHQMISVECIIKSLIIIFFSNVKFFISK